MKTKRSPRVVLLRVEKGGLVPLDDLSREELRSRGYRVGDVLRAELKKARNPGFHRLMHQLGNLVAANVDGFDGLSAHAVLKRLLIEAVIACDQTSIKVAGLGMCVHNSPRSLSFDSMDEGEFREVSRQFAAHIAQTYWPNCTPEEIEQMAGCMPSEAA